MVMEKKDLFRVSESKLDGINLDIKKNNPKILLEEVKDFIPEGSLDYKNSEAQYEAFKMEVEGRGGFARLINSFRDEDGLYPEELTNEVIKNLSLIPVFKKNPKIYLIWSKEKNEQTRRENINQEQEKKSERYNRIDLMLKRDKKPYQSLGIGIHKNHFYYGSVLEEGDKKFSAVITDDKKIYVCWYNKLNDEIKDDFGLNYRFELFDDCVDYMWSNQSINDFLNHRIDPKESINLLNEIKNNNKTIWHSDERAHDFIGCDIMKNYVYPIFNTIGRTHFEAEYESGKSKQSLNYQLMSFNPLFAGNITPASFERVIESTGGTIIVDNFDNYPDDLKKLVLQVIEVYYKKGAKTIKSDGQGKNKNKPMAYNGYSPLVINNIIGLPETPSSRCNRIRMLKTNNKKIVDIKINPKNPRYQILRDDLHIWALSNWKKIRDVYEDLEVPELSARDLEKVEAVLTIAKFIGDDVYKNVLNWILENKEQQDIKEISDNWDFILFEHLNEIIESEEKIKVKDITETIAEKHFDSSDFRKFRQDKIKFSHYIGKVLGNNPLFKKSVIHGWVHYNIKRDDLDRMIKIKGFDKYLPYPPYSPLPHPTSPNHTHLTQHHPTIPTSPNHTQ